MQAPFATLNDMAADQQHDPDVFSDKCPSRVALSAVADKWLVLVVHALEQGSARHGELMKQIDGVTQPTLTRALRQMETAGIVTRTVFPEVPPRVEYELTERGRSLAGPVRALADWAEANLEAFLPPPTDED
jgi:DNA-binding HxlR family transcriptional regulator